VVIRMVQRMHQKLAVGFEKLRRAVHCFLLLFSLHHPGAGRDLFFRVSGDRSIGPGLHRGGTSWT
jgi:hypothetical protein